MRQLENNAGVGRLRGTREGRADQDERRLVGHFAADLPAENLQSVLRHGLHAGDGRRALLLRRQRGRFGRAFDDDLLRFGKMFGEPVAAVVERRAMRIDFGHPLRVGARHQNQFDAHGQRLADLRRFAGFRLGQAHELVGCIRDDAAGGVLDRHEDMVEFPRLQPRKGFLHRGTFA